MVAMNRIFLLYSPPAHRAKIRCSIFRFKVLLSGSFLVRIPKPGASPWDKTDNGYEEEKLKN
jgi:hypothetical protein